MLGWMRSIYPTLNRINIFMPTLVLCKVLNSVSRWMTGRQLPVLMVKKSYLLVADRATRMIWVNVSNSKKVPVEEVRVLLKKFKSTSPHRTIRTDQDKALGKSVAFAKMCKEEEFLVELTGTDNSKQNSRAERPHRDLSTMMRCMLHSADLGPEYWS